MLLYWGQARVWHMLYWGPLRVWHMLYWGQVRVWHMNEVLEMANPLESQAALPQQPRRAE